jgi:hypothetical protein
MNALASIDRSNRAEVRNPVLALPGFGRLRALPEPVREALRAILMDLGADADERAAACWRKHKAPMAAYWKAVGVYARHIAKALRSGVAA